MISVISMSSKVMPPSKVTCSEPSCASLISSVSVPPMPRPNRFIGSSSVITAFSSVVGDNKPVSSDMLESLYTLSVSAIAVSSISSSSGIAPVTSSVGRATGGLIDRSLPSATPPSMISEPWIRSTVCDMNGKRIS